MSAIAKPCLEIRALSAVLPNSQRVLRSVWAAALAAPALVAIATTIFFPWTRGNAHERFVTLVAEGKGKLKLRIGSVRVGFRTLEVETG